ncbi:MAG: DUF1343 domain-containing protein [Bacteroidales bacterium]|nr:DUF1343 domain-containing protein [Bacteroidales bacterium]
MIKIILYPIIFLLFIGQAQAQIEYESYTPEKIYPKDIQVGAQQFDKYVHFVKNKNVVVLGNQTSMVGDVHLVDFLISKGIAVKKVMSPEHGFRGNAGAGEHVADGKDAKTGLPIISLYGNHRKPTKEDLDSIDVVIFDLQDVGTRFYTYISTLQYLMEACAEHKVQVIVLDRPNPNGYFVDGPILESKYKSFVGMQPIPIVHGMTVGEYALMLNGEGWLKDSIKCDLEVISVIGYQHDQLYQLPIKPSPNLPTMEAIYLYPTLCLFEGTVVSVGRGTKKPFELVGHPDLTEYDTIFTPKPIKGVAPHPKLQGEECKGHVLTNYAQKRTNYESRINIYWIVIGYFELGGKDSFFTSFFDTLAGSDKLRKQIIAGATEDEIRASWQKEINNFKKIRSKYLLYQDFE